MTATDVKILDPRMTNQLPEYATPGSADQDLRAAKQECAQLKSKLHSVLYRVLQDYVIPEGDINAVEFEAVFSRYSWEQLEQEWINREARNTRAEGSHS